MTASQICRRIGRIVFLPADVGLHIGRRHQSGIMAKFDQLARPIVGRTTGFQSNEAMGRKAAKECQDLLATQGFGDDHAPVVIDRMDLEYVLCQIKSNNGYGRKISSNFAHERRSSGQGFEGGHIGTPLRYGGARGERRPPHQESLRALAKRYGVNQKTVAKWKKRSSVSDERTEPKDPHSTVLSLEEEAIVVAFRKHTLLPLDDCLYALQATIPHLTRSSLHRCLQRHGISRLPDVEGDKPAKMKFKSYPIGFFHIDIAEVQTAEGKLYLFVAIDRTSKFAFAKLFDKANMAMATAFLEDLIAAVPYVIHSD